MKWFMTEVISIVAELLGIKFFKGEFIQEGHKW